MRLCQFNRTYGRGMSVAAIGAVRLDRCLRDHLRRNPDRTSVWLFAGLPAPAGARSAVPWLITTSEDHATQNDVPAKRKLTIRFFAGAFGTKSTSSSVLIGPGVSFSFLLVIAPCVLSRLIRFCSSKCCCARAVCFASACSAAGDQAGTAAEPGGDEPAADLRRGLAGQRLPLINQLQVQRHPNACAAHVGRRGKAIAERQLPGNAAGSKLLPKFAASDKRGRAVVVLPAQRGEEPRARLALTGSGHRRQRHQGCSQAGLGEQLDERRDIFATATIRAQLLVGLGPFCCRSYAPRTA